MFYAAYRLDGKLYSNLYYSYEKYFNDTFSPDTEDIITINFKIHGKTYEERKSSLEQIAINFSLNELPGLSLLEIAEIQSWFEKNGKRFGLLKEFRKNAIC